MVSVFETDKLRELLKDFYRISHIRITVFDEEMNELVAWPEQVAPWCGLIRNHPSGLQACRDCDRQACKTAEASRTTHIYHCHAGMIEAVTPLYVRDMTVGYLLLGHVLPYESCEENLREILQRCSALSLDEGKLRDSLFRAETFHEDHVRSAAHILHAMASYLILERMAAVNAEMPEVQLDHYLSDHFTEPLDASRISRDLGIGKTQLYALSQQLYGMGIASRVRKLRIDHAMDLLQKSPMLSIAEVAWQCGFQDYNYFITVFKRETGNTPGAWRMKKVQEPEGANIE